jgi:hypothetical protein
MAEDLHISVGVATFSCSSNSGEPMGAEVYSYEKKHNVHLSTLSLVM